MIKIKWMIGLFCWLITMVAMAAITTPMDTSAGSSPVDLKYSKGQYPPNNPNPGRPWNHQVTPPNKVEKPKFSTALPGSHE